MKYLLVILIACSCYFCNAQTFSDKSPVLQLTKKRISPPKQFIIDQNQRIKVITNKGKKLTFTDYNFQGDSSIAARRDTVLLKNVMILKGHIKVSKTKRVVGKTVMITGIVYTAAVFVTAVGGTAFTGNPALLLLPIPAAGVAFAGSAIAGKRRFNNATWKLRIVPKAE